MTKKLVATHASNAPEGILNHQQDMLDQSDPKRVVVKEDSNGGGFTADRPALSGSPVVGRGRTWLEALGDLVLQGQREFGVSNVRVVKADGTPYDFRGTTRYERS